MLRASTVVRQRDGEIHTLCNNSLAAGHRVRELRQRIQSSAGQIRGHPKGRKNIRVYINNDSHLVIIAARVR